MRSGLVRLGTLVGALAVVGGCATQPGQLVFRVAPLNGIVYTDSGAPLGWATLAADGHRAVTSDAYGRFMMPRIRRGIVRIMASAAGHEPITLTEAFTNRDQVLYVRLRSWHGLATEARAELRAGRNRSALELAERAAAVAPSEPVVVMVHAIALEANGRPHDALARLAAMPEDVTAPAVALLRERLEEAAR